MSSIEQKAVSVTTSATPVVTENVRRRTLYLTNNEASAKIFVGGEDVTASNGTPIKAGETLPLWNAPGDVPASEAWFAIVATGTGDLRVLEGIN